MPPTNYAHAVSNRKNYNASGKGFSNMVEFSRVDVEVLYIVDPQY